MQILADHPRLYLNAGSTPGTEWLRLRGPVPADRMDPAQPEKIWKAKDDSVALPSWLGLPGFRHSIGLARWWHFSFDVFWLANGIIFFILLLRSGQWQRIVPQSWDVFPNALSTTVQYLSLDLPANEGFTRYNGLQLIALLDHSVHCCTARGRHRSTSITGDGWSATAKWGGVPRTKILRSRVRRFLDPLRSKNPAVWPRRRMAAPAQRRVDQVPVRRHRRLGRASLGNHG